MPKIKTVKLDILNKKDLNKFSKKHQKQIKVIIPTYYYIDRKISRYKYRYIEKNRELNPFTNVTFCYGNDQNEITVPAIVLVKSRGDVVLYDDFYKSNIDWKSLTEEKKRELYTEFVLHYLPKELGDAAVGNPITFLIMIIVGAVIAKASAVIAACASLIGTGFSAVNIIEGCKLITKVAEGYDSISDVNAAKVSAKDCARGIALLGVEIIPVLFGLIKRGFAKYNGKEIKVGENVADDVTKKKVESSVEDIKLSRFSEMEESEILKIVEMHRKKAPIKIPESANVKAKSMNEGYEQISYKWNDGIYKYEVRWHTRTPGAPKDQGNTWVIQRTKPGNGGQKPSTQFLIGDNEWVEGWKWYDAIKARKEGTATKEQIEILDRGHWKE